MFPSQRKTLRTTGKLCNTFSTLPFCPSSKELWPRSFSSPFHLLRCSWKLLTSCPPRRTNPQLSSLDSTMEKRPCAQAPYHPAAQSCPAWRHALRGQVRLPNLRGPDQDQLQPDARVVQQRGGPGLLVCGRKPSVQTQE